MYLHYNRLPINLTKTSKLAEKKPRKLQQLWKITMIEFKGVFI